jgi:hypothetical protein
MFRRAPVPCRPHAVSDLFPPELAKVMQRLRRAGIPCEVHVGQAIAVSLGDEDVGPSAQATFPLAASGRAARWLHRSALILFEPNGYSRRYSRRFDPVSVLAQLWRPF